jgi:SAM-dependent methyltransferase
MSHMSRGDRWRVKGLEADPQAAAYARERLGLDVLCARLPDNPFGERVFDVITGWHVVEHLHDPLGGLRALRAMLRPGGSLVLALPNPASLDARFYRSAWVAYDAPRHIYHYAPQSVRQLLGEVGFKLVHQRQMPLDAVYNVLLSLPLAFRLGFWRGLWGSLLAPNVLGASLVAGMRGVGSAMLYVARRET